MSSLLLPQQQWSSASSSAAPSIMSSVLLVSARELLEASNASSSAAAAASNSSDPYVSPYGLNSRFNPSMAIIIVVLLSAFFFMGFFSVYIRRCTTEEEPRLPRNNSGGAAPGAADGRSRSCRGLDKDLVDSLPLVTYSAVSSKDNSECVVCLSEFQDMEALRMLPKCGHAFHQDCIDMWLFSHTTCPLCRRSLLPEKVSSFRALFTFGSSNRGARMDAEANDNSGNGGGGEPETGLNAEQQRSPAAAPQNGGSRIRAAIVRKLRRSNSTGHSSTAIARPPFVSPPLENVEEDNSSQSFNFRMPLLASDFHRSRSVTELAYKNPWFGQQEEEEDPSKHEDPKRSTSFSFWLPNTTPRQEAPSSSNTKEEESASLKPSLPSISSSMRRSLKLFSSGFDKPFAPITQMSSSHDVEFLQLSRIL